jgi:hypothetical protein
MGAGVSSAWGDSWGVQSGGGGPGPVTPTISIVGTTLTVTGSSVGSSNRAYSTPYSYLGGGVWTSAGVRTGDGNITLALAAGTYLIQVISTLNSQSVATNVLFYVVVNTAASIYYQILQAVQTAIQALSLELPSAGTLPAGQVYLRKVLTDRDVTAPCVIVFQPPAAESMLDGTNERDDTGYPVGIAIVSVSNQDYAFDSDDDPYAKWRQRIRRRFNNVRIAVDQVYRCLWEPSPLIDYGLWQQSNIWVQGGVIRVVNRETRDPSA